MKDYSARFTELLTRGRSIPIQKNQVGRFVDRQEFGAWLTSALNIVEQVFGPTSTLTLRMKQKVEGSEWRAIDLESALGIFAGAAEEYSLGYFTGLKREISAEFIVDACIHAETLVSEGYIQSAAVLAAAALEDCFKRQVEELGIDTTDKTLSDYINCLKSAEVIAGAAAKIVSGFPKFRNAAMHADWDKITSAEIIAVTGFVKHFAIQPR